MDEFLRQFLMFITASSNEGEAPAGGLPAAVDEEVASSENDTSNEQRDESSSEDEPLEEAGKKALQVEREARKTAEEALSELSGLPKEEIRRFIRKSKSVQEKAASLEADPDAQLAQSGTANEDAVKEAQALAQQAQDDLAKTQADVARFKIAARFGISAEPGEDNSPSDAEMFLTGSTEEELISQAQRLKAIRQASLDDALVDPTQGGGGRPAPVEVEPGAPRLAAALDAQINK